VIVIKDFFINFSILFTGVFLIHQYFHSDRVSIKSSVQKRLRRGILYGLFGVIIMQFGIPIEGGTLIDLRTIPMMIAAYSGGWVSTFVATTIIIICRLVLYPISNSSLINIIILTLTAIAFSLITKSNLKTGKKWLFMALSFTVIIGSFIHFVIPEFKKGIIIFFQYSFAIGFATFVTYLLKSYLWRSDDNYEKLKEYSQKDYLTGLNNTRTFHKVINSLFSKAQDHKEELSLLTIDIDHFKQINDTYGHLAGDKVIIQIGHLLLQLCRSQDIVSRNGGEEFSIIMPDCDLTYARIVAERIRKGIEKSIFVVNENVDLYVTVSIGYATFNQIDTLSVGQLIEEADKGLYTAKRSGRNRISSVPTL
jgi:diguanylate cyclase